MRTPRLDRDHQQWMFDYLVKETGRVFHWDTDGRVLPASVRSHYANPGSGLASY